MARWHSCNVLQMGATSRELWRFNASGDALKLVLHESKLGNEPLNQAAIVKDWQTLYRKKLNIAWIPPEKVYLRVVQIPAADASEAQSMLELQLERISAIPPQQAMWTFELLPATQDPLRTAILVIVERSYVEQFMGKLEEQGFMADRLEVQVIDELLATRGKGNGAWIMAGLGPDKMGCLVAWWQDDVLRNLTMLHVPPEPGAAQYLKQQLDQMAWSGELEGWLSGAPQLHLVADPETMIIWRSWLQSENTPVQTVTAMAVGELAVCNAKRAASTTAISLVPPEYPVRYRQTFIDRIWMRSLGAIIMVYLVGVLIYVGALEFLRMNVNKLEKTHASKSTLYEAAMKSKAEVQVLQDQIDLQFAALECWKATATLLPTDLVLEGFNFQRGKSLSIFGTGPADGSAQAGNYSEALKKTTYKGVELFNTVGTPDLRQSPQGLRWTLNAELKRNITE